MKVTIKETLCREIDVPAKNERDALYEAEDLYNRCEVVLDYSDHVKTEYSIAEDDAEPVTETDFIYVRNLMKEYHPAERGFVTEEEKDLITKTLLLKSRDILSLRNLRNLVVAVLTNHVDKTIADSDVEQYEAEKDRISAITHVIDARIFSKGGEV